MLGIRALLIIVLIISAIVLGPAWAAFIAAAWSAYRITIWSEYNKAEHIKAERDVDVPPQFDYSADIKSLLSRSTEETKMSGDDRFLAKAKDIGARAQESIINRARFVSDNLRKYFDEELTLEENRHWWENDELDVE